MKHIKSNYAVIMAGGIGSRFWPYSRTNFPKQFHDILGVGKSMLTLTAERFEGVVPQKNIYVVTHKNYAELVKESLPWITEDQILLEPVGKNTAPCIAYAVYKIQKQNANATILVSPSDQYVLKVDAYKRVLHQALDFAATHTALVTVGIVPTRPDTGYGYIQYDKSTQEDIKHVKRFAEKPNLETALQFLASGDFVWNSGLFIFNSNAAIKAFETHAPKIASDFAKGTIFYFTDKEQQFITETYANCESISFDYAVMEKASDVRVLLGYFGWSDVGTWKSLYEVSARDEDQNVIDGLVRTYNTTDCIIKTPKDKLVVLNGLEGYIVAESDGVLMICKKEEEQRVKLFLEDCKKEFGDRFI